MSCLIMHAKVYVHWFYHIVNYKTLNLKNGTKNTIKH